MPYQPPDFCGIRDSVRLGEGATYGLGSALVDGASEDPIGFGVPDLQHQGRNVSCLFLPNLSNFNTI